MQSIMPALLLPIIAFIIFSISIKTISWMLNKIIEYTSEKDYYEDWPEYPNLIRKYFSGAETHFTNNKYSYIKYSNGDEIWLSYLDGYYLVNKIRTYDGQVFNYGTKLAFEN